MAYNSYPDEVAEYIFKNYKRLNDRMISDEIFRIFGIKKSAKAIHSWRRGHGILCTGRQAAGIQLDYKKQNDIPEHIKDVICWLCTTMTDPELSQFLKERCSYETTASAVKQFRHRNKIQNGRTGCWGERDAGIYNTRIKPGEHRSPKTEFKKGYKPANLMPVLSERYNPKVGYTLVKVRDGKWQVKARYVWEQAHGPIPPGKILLHIDHNPVNDELENLRLVDIKTLGRLSRDLTEDIEFNNALISLSEIENIVKEE